MHARPQTRHPGRPPGGVRAQSEEAAALRTGLRPHHTQGRTEGSQLRQGTEGAHPVPAAETERFPTGSHGTAVHHQRAEEGAAAVEGFHEGDEDLQSGDAGYRRCDGEGRGAEMEQFADEG